MNPAENDRQQRLDRLVALHGGDRAIPAIYASFGVEDVRRPVMSAETAERALRRAGGRLEAIGSADAAPPARS